ncbi:MAG: pilus assembly protein [Rhizobiales bacterium]|nr:pilus assembly protein [Hyphomicrobiales bacterium]
MPNSIQNYKTAKCLRLPKILKRFRKEEDGVTAIEFGMLGIPFFLIVTSIIEVSLFFFAGQYLDHSVDQVARKVRVGALPSNMTQADFKDVVCKEASLMLKCSKIKVDLKVVASYDDIGDDSPAPVNGALDDDEYGFAQPGASQIVQLTVHYEWPVFTNFVAQHWADLDDGALMSSVAAFRTEAF